jgi:hypothetical protein
MSNQKYTKLVPFVDNVGRIIVGRTIDKPLSKTAKFLEISNPAIVNIQMQEDGQVSVQLIPYMFREFLTEQSQEQTVWQFNVETITFSKSVSLDDRINEQYRQIFEITDEEREALITQMQADQTASGDTAAEPGVVKLFDEGEVEEST